MLMRRYPAAAVEFRKLTELDPQSAPALNNLAAALLESRQPEGAVASLRKAAELVPQNASLHANMGMVLARINGHLDEGIEELRLALRLSPNDPKVKAALDAALAAKAKGRN
jgi:Flp pilus assembly protein TadD